MEKNDNQIRYSNYWRLAVMKTVKDSEDAENLRLGLSDLPPRGFSVFKGQILEYVKTKDRDYGPQHQLAIALEDSYTRDPQVLIVPIEFKQVLDFEKNEENKKKNIKKFELGILPLLNSQIPVVAIINEIRILDKRYIKKDARFFARSLGHAPDYLIDEIYNRYLTFTGLKILNNEKKIKNHPIYLS